MALINKHLLQKTLKENRHQILNTQKIFDHLKIKIYDRIQSKTFKKEEAEKPVILPKLFELLGYSHPENFEFEFANQSRSADITLGVESQGVRQPEVMIEWKGIDTTSLDKGKAGETPVSQMWDYIGKTNANFGIVSNFKEFRLYSKQKGQTEFYQVYLEDIINNTDKLEEFVFLFRKTTLLKGDNKQSFLEDLISQSETEQEQITKRFYNDYKQRRLNLFGHLVENNPEINKHILVEKSQKILDRLIFVMFCEDSTNNLLPRNILTDTYNLGKKNRSRSETKIWEQFQYLFEDIDKGRYDIQPNINAYNGGLFAEDLELNNLVIKNEVWEWFNQISEKYDFESDLNVNILGHIFEQSISDIEEIKSEIEVAEGFSLHKGTDISIKVGDSFSFPGAKNGQVNLAPTTTKPKTSKRKKDGIYYTPEYITDYIVSETIGNWLNDQKVPLVRGQAEDLGVVDSPLETIKILDPAGGSGAFPNQVHNYLTKKHEAKFKELSTDENDLFNQVQIDKSILKNNIFMVDLQPESVEIAKLSLWLKTAKKDQKLNNLDGNVKCGNSLKINWREYFALPGFDVILGNPPYIKEYTNKSAFNGLHDSPYYQGKMDLWTMFACIAIDELKEGGYLAFIAPNNWISNAGASIFRNKILSDGELQTFIDFGDFKVFEDAGIQTMVFVFKKCKPREKYTVNYARVEDKNTSLENIKLLLSSKLTADIDGIIKFQAEIEPAKLKGKNLSFVNKAVDQILEKMEAGERWLLDKDEVAQGIVAPQEFVTERHLENSNIEAKPNDGIFQLTTEEKESLNLTSQELELIKPFYTTDQLGKYTADKQNNLWVIYTKSDIKSHIEKYPNIKTHLDRFSQVITSDNKPYGLHRARDERFFIGEKIISLRKCTEPTFSFVDFDCYVSQTYYIIKTERVNLKFLTGVLNSKIAAFWFRHKGKMQGDLYQIDKDPLLNIPIPQATTEQQAQIAELVDKIMILKKEMQDYLKNTFILLQAEIGGQKITLNKKLEKFWTLDFAEFLSELTKQKIQLSNPQKRNLITSFETDKKKILELEQQVEKVDAEIEGLVRGLYGVD
jgi:hypothetical protein